MAMDLIQQVADFLTQQGATDVQVTRNDSNTEYERQHRITCVFDGRAYEMDVGLVRQHGGISQ
jgi:hypothetical protein